MVDAGRCSILEAHLKECTYRSAFIDGTRNVVKLMGDGKAFDVPARASQRFYAKLNDFLPAHPSEKRGR